MQQGALVVWRVDPVLQARRVVVARRPALADAARARLVAAATRSQGALLWSGDPTRPAWDPAVQASVAAALRTGRVGDRRLAALSARAAAPAARQRSFATLPLGAALLAVYRLDVAAGTDTAARRATASLALHQFARVRAATHRNWTQAAPGTWSTLGQHKLLVARGRALLTRRPHAATRAVVERLTAALVAPPSVKFARLPAAAFYPWPRDGAFDTEAVEVSLDRPATVQLTVFGAGDTAIRRIDRQAVPGSLDITWDGAADDGGIQAAGEYRYAVTATDLAGNQQLVAGLQTFIVARDTTAPTAKAGTVHYSATKAGRRLTATWSVEEVHSPKVRTYLLLASGTTRTSVRLHDSLQRATVRRPTTLKPGTWRASYVFVDGSGNRTNLSAGTFVVR